MKRLNLLCAAVLGISSVMANAQINQTPVHSGGSQILVSGEKALAATGSMFITEKYLPAKITGNDNIVLLRYNGYSDYFEISNPQEQSVKALPKVDNAIITFSGTGHEYTLVDYKTDNGETQKGYLSIISNNPKVKIYKRERVYLQPGSTSSNSYQSSKAPLYKRAADEFYLKLDGTEASYFDGKKDFSKLVPGKSKEVLEYIKKNSLNLENATDLQKLADYVATVI